MGRYEELKARHERAEAKLGMGGGSPGSPGSQTAGGKGKLVWIGFALILLAAAGAGLLWSRGGSDQRLKAATAANKEAVGLVVAVSDGSMHPFGTAWARAPDTYVSNAHVTDVAAMLAEKGLQIAIVVNQRPDLVLPVLAVRKHVQYSEEGAGFDVAELRVAGQAPKTFPVASREVLHALQAGESVAYLGFPMENLFEEGVSVRNPVAVMQAGIVVAVSDFRQEPAGPQGNVLIRHNLGATGGASGSPIFNVDGKVVGVLNAGHITGNLVAIDEDGNPALVSAPSAAMINFAQRVDLLETMGGMGAWISLSQSSEERAP